MSNLMTRQFCFIFSVLFDNNATQIRNSHMRHTINFIVTMSGVWIRLHIEGQDNAKFDAWEIEPAPKNITGLKKAVYDAYKNALRHCDAPGLKCAPTWNQYDD